MHHYSILRLYDITLFRAAAVGSMPSSALYFLAYEQIKHNMQNYGLWQYVVASSIGECLACLVRVPTEVCEI